MRSSVEDIIRSFEPVGCVIRISFRALLEMAHQLLVRGILSLPTYYNFLHWTHLHIRVGAFLFHSSMVNVSNATG